MWPGLAARGRFMVTVGLGRGWGFGGLGSASGARALGLRVVLCSVAPAWLWGAMAPVSVLAGFLLGGGGALDWDLWAG